jgi:type IV pilus assembly protein PilZ
MSDEDREENKRRSERLPIELKVEYKRLNTFFSDYTKNISKGGTFIKTRKPLDVGTAFLFRLHVPGRELPFELNGVVKWVREAGDEPGMGIEFLFPDEGAQKALDSQVEALMSESLGERISSHLLHTKK